MQTLILIPTYNEAENIRQLITEIFNIISSDCSVLIIDGNSSDKTSEIIHNLQSTYSFLYILKQNSKSGIASAYIDGFHWGIEHNFKNFITMDADFSHSPKYLPVFSEYLKEYDVVIGSRNIKNGNAPGLSFQRNIISKLGSIYSRYVLGMFKNTIYDLTGGYNAYSLNALKKIDVNSILAKGYLFQIEMKYKVWKNQCKFLEIPIIFETRKYGKSKINMKIFIEALFDVWKIKTK